METKTIVGVLVGAIVTGLAVWILNGFTTKIDKGSAAITEEQIRAVLKAEQTTTINGVSMTYGEALSKISTNQILMQRDIDRQGRALERLIEP